jgi:Ca-activated chloride channel family protein
MSPLLAQFEFAIPARLFWLALLPLLVFFSLRSRATLPGAFRWLSLGCRMLLVATLIVALAGPRSFGPSRQRFVVVATDVSRSVGATATPKTRAWIDSIIEAGRGHRISFLPFAGRVGNLGDDPEGAADALDPSASDPGQALRIATALIPGDYVPQVVLLTDGNENRGELARAAYSVNLPVHVAPLSAFPQPEVCLAEVSAPASVARGMEIPVIVQVRSNREGQGQLVLLANGEQLERREIALTIGENRFEYRVPSGAVDRITLEARVESDDDAIAENNRRRAEVAVRRGSRVLLVAAESDGQQPVRALLEQQRFDVTAVTPEVWQGQTDEWSTCDVCLLLNVAPRQVAAQLPNLERFVREQAGGLIVAGGDTTFDWQALHGSPLESLLPVTAARDAEPSQEVLAMVLVVDRSSSMQQEQRMILAKEAAKQSIQVLAPTDKVGVIAFSDAPQWITDLAPRGDGNRIAQRIDGLEPYGQTQMYPAVERAFLALEQTDADRKHMILVTDGIPAPGDYLAIARRIADAGMTLSAITISPGAERDLLQRMARLASGRYHHCDDPADAPEILIEETQEVAGHDEPRRFVPFALRSLPGLDVADAPPLEDYSATDLKRDAEPLLYAVGGSPLLSWRRCGAGISIALTTEVGSGTGQAWMSWAGHGAFWKRLVRHAARPPARHPVDVRVAEFGESTRIVIDALDEAGNYDRRIQRRVRVGTPDGSLREVPAMLAASGRYTVTIPTRTAGRYEIQVQADASDRGDSVAACVWYRDYPDELLLRPPADGLLRSVAATTGGIYAPTPSDIFQDDGRTVQRMTTFTVPLLLAALFLVLLDVALRRGALMRTSD